MEIEVPKRKERGKMHVAMYPWYGMGHSIPFVHMANELAARGHRVSILASKKAQAILQPHNHHPNLVTFITITIPHVDGLPEGAELGSDVPMENNHLLSDAMILTRPQVESILAADVPHLVIHDFAFWIPQVAAKLGIKSVCFLILSASSMAAAITPPPGSAADDEKKPPLPPYPSSTVVLRPDEMAAFLNAPDFECMMTLNERLMTSIKDCDAVAIRTCRELEGKFCDYMQAVLGKRVLLTGYLLPEDKSAQMEPRWADWLARFEPGSVIYCAFGSQYFLEKEQFQELLVGMEMTGMPFFLALRPPVGCSTVEEGFPEGFEERVKGRGVVHGGWVPQRVFLNHPSVGCFVSHGGFGSMWESLMCDIRMVLIPFIGDQMYNTRLICTDSEVGVEVGRGPNRWFSKESLNQAIRSVMDKHSELAVKLKKNHDALRKVFTQPGFCSGYADRYVQSLEDIVNNQDPYVDK